MEDKNFGNKKTRRPVRFRECMVARVDDGTRRWIDEEASEKGESLGEITRELLVTDIDVLQFLQRARAEEM